MEVSEPVSEIIDHWQFVVFVHKNRATSNLSAVIWLLSQLGACFSFCSAPFNYSVSRWLYSGLEILLLIYMQVFFNLIDLFFIRLLRERLHFTQCAIIQFVFQ